MNLCTGWLPDPPDPRDWRYDDSTIAAARPVTGADAVDWRRFDAPRVQLFNSCVGHAIVASAALCMAIRREPITFPSAQLEYTGARLLWRKQVARPVTATDPLEDLGSNARLAMIWGRDHGLVAEERWPESHANIDAVPPLDVWQEGACATLEAFYRIEHNDGAADAVLSALRRGHCPAFAMMVDQKWSELRSGVYDGPGGAVIGGHMQVVLGFEPSVDALRVRNTWAGWGEDGYGLITRAAFNRMARDIWVPTAAPEVR